MKWIKYPCLVHKILNKTEKNTYVQYRKCKINKFRLKNKRKRIRKYKGIDKIDKINKAHDFST